MAEFVMTSIGDSLTAGFANGILINDPDQRRPAE